MTLVQLVYSSRPAGSPASRDLMQILGKARARNAATGITGLLCYTGARFLQVLEGERDDVCETFYRILRDERHIQVRLLAFHYPTARGFAEWAMGYAGTGDMGADVMRRHVAGGTSDQLGNDAETTTAFLRDLARSLASDTAPGF